MSIFTSAESLFTYMLKSGSGNKEKENHQQAKN